jgi:hypothetical protein
MRRIACSDLAALAAGLLAAWPVAAAGLPASEANPPAFEARVLAAHNRARAEVGVPPLVWDAGLAAAARRWGERLASTGGFSHEGGSKAQAHGENLFMGTARAFPVETMLDMWEAEKSLLDGPHDWYRHFPEAGHYTQMVWRTTERVGCSLVSNLAFEYLVCRYDRPGNVRGQPVW